MRPVYFERDVTGGGHPVSFHFYGWGRQDLGDDTGSGERTGELGSAYLEYRHPTSEGVTLEGEVKQIRHDLSDPGDATRAGLGVRVAYNGGKDLGGLSSAIVSADREENEYQEFRAFGSYTRGPLRFTLDALTHRYKQAPGGSPIRDAYQVVGPAGWQLLSFLTLSADLTYTRSPRFTQDYAGLLRVAFDLDRGMNPRPGQGQTCHGTDLTGGIANTSCFTAACHHDAIPTWADPVSHGAAAKRAPGNSGFVSCRICHGSDLSGDGAGIACSDCHGVNAPHPAAPWRAPPGIPFPVIAWRRFEQRSSSIDNPRRSDRVFAIGPRRKSSPADVRPGPVRGPDQGTGRPSNPRPVRAQEGAVPCLP